MDCALSESIFCWPRATRFFLREEDDFPFAEAVWTDDFLFPEEAPEEAAEEAEECFCFLVAVDLDEADLDDADLDDTDFCALD